MIAIITEILFIENFEVKIEFKNCFFDALCFNCVLFSVKNEKAHLQSAHLYCKTGKAEMFVKIHHYLFL